MGDAYTKLLTGRGMGGDQLDTSGVPMSAQRFLRRGILGV